MKKFIEKYGDIFQLVGIIAFTFLLTTDRFPLLEEALFFLWLAGLVWGIIDNLMFRAGLKKNEIRYPTLNDDYSKYSKLGLGLAIAGISLACALWIPSMDVYAKIGVAVGILILIAGLLDLPSGIIKLKGEKLKLSGVSDKVDMCSIQKIEIEESTLVLTNTGSKVLKQDKLKLDVNSAIAIEHFFLRYLGEREKVKNNVR
ncbi:hypothetical protein [Rufibacter roseus]|uniref:Uncharacterized protein n=1 Tax=Rufibacter roseus TaxID=1567108 RepID=A0ABW2DMG3_9BACT|nr:hypothetical protein [Rufibacter roseus]